MSERRMQTSDLVGATDAADEPIARGATDDGERGGRLEPLFDPERSDRLRGQWRDLQARFVDDPREAVEQADGLVAETLRDLARSFDGARSGLEAQWTRGDDVSTEELRLTLQRYRSFFERLLDV